MQLLNVLFGKEDKSIQIFDSIFSHLGSRSTVDLLTRIFTIENGSYIDERYQMFARMLDYLNKTESIDVKMA
jgi:hypothetical protein